ncbi:uncharacterized protein DNG_04546 [Cephalotrichum gorgonifer]|uniref:Glyoxalase/fosfomycin resistance/dioxygenase domain-containing protein n=1 Tax=Cephalotrichum gorgonifer TaxID=2041049 RepID=A0AAE8SUN1_9PEZI|nr:uncharacterized protein DNG_04546 [Cephalotrichum gorgonifer]
MPSGGLEQTPPASSQARDDPGLQQRAGPTAARDSAPSSTTTLSAATPKLQSICPVFSTSDLDRWLDHYRTLGFDVDRYGDEYGFARLDGIEIHVSVNPDHDPATTAGCAYVRVDDADALHARWSTVEGGRGPAPVDTSYGLREGGHLDPDGNLIRYGSSITRPAQEEGA